MDRSRTFSTTEQPRLFLVKLFLVGTSLFKLHKFIRLMSPRQDKRDVHSVERLFSELPKNSV